MATMIEEVDEEREEVKDYVRLFKRKWVEGDYDEDTHVMELADYYEHGEEVKAVLEEGWISILDILWPEVYLCDRSDPENWAIICLHEDYDLPLVLDLGVAKVICPHFVSFWMLKWRAWHVKGPRYYHYAWWWCADRRMVSLGDH